MLSRLGTLLRERFPPATHLPMVTAFAAAHVAWAWAVGAAPGAPPRAGIGAVWMMDAALAWLFTLSAFVRLRLFDEVKDLATDRRLAPHRPLARGLVSVREILGFAAVLAALELAIAWRAGALALVAAAIALAYTLLMAREFFAGRWLRRSLTLYALPHTAVSMVVAAAVAALVLDAPPWALPAPVAWLCLAAWPAFNLFEFARKTWAPQEERAGHASYSQDYGLRGAIALALSQAAAAVALVAAASWSLDGAQPARILLAVAPLAVPAAAAAWLWRVASPRRAAAFRAACGAFLVACYLAATALALWRP